MRIGIETLAFYTPHYFLDLRTLAEKRGVDVKKYYDGIGQEKMAVAAPDEDVVTMAANAAHHALEGIDRQSIGAVMFATESGIDQSKAAAIYVHSLLGLPKNCMSFEIKQACCGSTAALQMSLGFVAQNPKKKVLILASDVARYDLDSPGEATQGAGAAAMVVSVEPRILDLSPEWGTYTEDVMDFWRPNYREEALVDGKYSIKVYLRALTEAWREYQQESGRDFDDHDYYCYHLPFNKMSRKAHLHLARLTHHDDIPDEELLSQIEEGLSYSRVTGNSYTASLYLGLMSLLETSRCDLTGKRIGLFSYGSGCMAAFFSGVVLPGYRKHLQTERHRRMLCEREELDFARYEDFYLHHLPTDGSDYETPKHETGLYRLAGIKDHKRIYEFSGAAVDRSSTETISGLQKNSVAAA